MAQFTDVTVGQRRRQALLQKLAGQRKQRRNDSSQLLQFPRRARPVAGEARTALSTPRSGRPQFTHATSVLRRLLSGLGPGGQGVERAFDQSSGRGIPVESRPPVGPPMFEPEGGVPWDEPQTLDEFGGGVSGSGHTNELGVQTVSGQTALQPNPLTQSHAGTGGDLAAPGGEVGAQMNASQLIPMGNGVYFDPNTNTYFGMPASTGARSLFRE